MNSQQLWGCILLVFGSMFAQLCRADQDVWFDLSAGADATAYPQFANAPEAMQPPKYALGQHLNGRVNLAWYPVQDVEFGLQYGLEQQWRFYQDDGDTRFADSLQPSGANFRWRDLDSELAGNDDNLTLYQNLDRFYGLLYTPAGEITAGRQAISFGLAKVYSPVDVIYPSSVRAQERSYRPGVDALRWRIPVGAVSELDVGWVFGRDQIIFGRAYTLVNSLTLETIALSVNQDHYLIGLGTQTAIGTWGLWQEIALLRSDSESDIRATLGVDQQVFEDVYVIAEYHFNSLGRSEDYQLRGDSAFYQLGMVAPWGRHYVSLQAGKPITPLLQAQTGLTVNLGDGSALATGRLEWSLTDNSSFDLSVDLPLGESPLLDNGQLQVEDEFGVYPAQISVNWSTVF